MTALAVPTPPQTTTVRVLAFGFLYWLAFLLVLQPGNALRATSPLDPWQEGLRIGGAALLGALATPLLVAWVRRYPPATLRGLAIAALGALTASAALITISCLLAPFVLTRHFQPFWEELAGNLAGNGLLLLFPIAGLMGIAHTLSARSHETSAPDTSHATQHAPIAVRSRGYINLVAPSEIDWIEAQGNYVALHANGRVHLLRETMTALEARLDPARFVRVSRGALVPLDRIWRITPRANGDAEVELLNGSTVPLSRRYRAAVWRRFEAG